MEALLLKYLPLSDTPSALVNAYLVHVSCTNLHCLTEDPDKYLMSFARRAGLQLNELDNGKIVVHGTLATPTIRSAISRSKLHDGKKWMEVVDVAEPYSLALAASRGSESDHYLIQFYVKVGDEKVGIAETVAALDEYTPEDRNRVELVFLRLQAALKGAIKLHVRYWKITGEVRSTQPLRGVPPGRFLPAVRDGA